jgi:hypothetical protein
MNVICRIRTSSHRAPNGAAVNSQGRKTLEDVAVPFSKSPEWGDSAVNDEHGGVPPVPPAVRPLP